MRLNRSIRNRGRRKKKGVMDLDITSLLDILVIMLVFLLKSYNSSGVVLNVPKTVSLPVSESQTMNTSGIIVQVSPETIWVDDKEVLNKKKKSPSSYLDSGNRRITPLFDELVRKRSVIKQIEKSTPGAKKFSGVINLIVDKNLKYTEIKKILFTCAEAGFKQYKFVVLGQES